MAAISRRWSSDYFAAIVSLLDKIIEQAECFCDTSPSEAAKLKENVLAFCMIYYTDAGKPLSDIDIHANLFLEEHMGVERLFYYALGGAGKSIGWALPEDEVEIEKYCQPLVDKVNAYVKEQEARMEAQRAREAVLAERIKEYISECEASGTKVVKKSLVTDEFDYNTVLRVWREI